MPFLEHFEDISNSPSFNKFMQFSYENVIKLGAIGTAFILRKTLLKIWNKTRFFIRIEHAKKTQESLDKIDRICDKLLFQLEASRVLFIHAHNGIITNSNLHLGRLTCLNESLNENIPSIKSSIVNSTMENFSQYVNYFINHKVLYYNDIELFEDEELQPKFQMWGIKSFFVIMVTIKEIPMGFLRVEFCDKKNHSSEDINKIIEDMVRESKKIYQILKP